MAARTAKTRTARASYSTTAASTWDLDTTLDRLRRKGTKATRESLARYAIHVEHAFGVTVSELRKIAKVIGTDHDLAAQLWNTQWYEAKMLATFIDDANAVTSAQMDRWCRSFDNWAIVDTACFALFDRTPHAWGKIEPWSKRRQEFEKRAAFALLWSLTVHDKQAADEKFLTGLELIERNASDDRHFVKKAINMALRATGKRNAALNAAATQVAETLARSKDPNARWVGQDALRELTSAKLRERLKKKR